MPPRGTSKSKAKAAAAEAVKENVASDGESARVAECDVIPKGGGKGKVVPGRNVTLADELEEMTRKMTMINLEKEKAELLLKERDAQLEQKNAEELRLQGVLEEKDQEQKRLAEKVRKLQKIKEFQPTIELSVNAAAGSKDLKKDANRIKRPLTPFLLWAKDQRVQVRNEHPEATSAEVGKILGDRWKAVPNEDKKPYEERYQVEKDVYLKIVGKEKREGEALKIFQEEHNKRVAVDFLEQYLQFQSDKANEDGKKKKKEKDPSKPKKPVSAFFVFSNERRPKMLAENMKIPEIGRKLGEEWKSLDEKSREPYEKTAAQDKARYGTELEAYNLKKARELEEAEEQSKEQTLIHKAQAMQLLEQREQIDQLLKQREQTDQVKKSSKGEKLKKKRVKAESADPNKPKKPLTSYILFVMENRKSIQQENPGASFSEVTAALAVRWQELAEAEKQRWADKAALSREAYKTAMEIYNHKQATVGGGQLGLPNESQLQAIDAAK